MSAFTELIWLLCVAMLSSSVRSVVVQPSANTTVLEGLSITSSHTSIQSTTTQHFSLNCSINPENMTNLATVVSLVISRWHPVSKDFVEFALLNYLNPRQVTFLQTTSAVGKGHLNAQGISFISLEWEFPGQDVAGKYICDAHAMDTFGHPDNLQVGLAVGFKQVDLASLTESVKMLLKKTSEQQRVIDSMNKTVDMLKKVNTMMINSGYVHFYSNESFGPFIIFAAFKSFRSFHDAQTYCARSGGKLLEMTPSDLSSVGNFLLDNSFPSGLYWIGWSRDNNGNWVFPSSNSTVSPINWFNQPSVLTDCAVEGLGGYPLNAIPCSNDRTYPALCMITF